MSKKGFEFVFVTDCKKFADGSIKDHFEVSYVPEYLKNDFQQKDVLLTEQKYGRPTLKAIYLSDQRIAQNLVNKTDAWWSLETTKYLNFWENFVREKEINCVITELGGELLRRTATAVAERNDVLPIYVNCGPLLNKYFLTSNEMGAFEGIRAIFDVVESENYDDAEEFLVKYRMQSKMMVFNKPPLLGLKSLMKFFKMIHQDIFVEKRQNPCFKFENTARNYVSRFFRARAVQRFYEKPNLGEKYVFLPLHCPWDMQLTVRAPQYLNQRYVVDQCYRSLPAGFKLYVKEHHASVGGYDYGFLKHLSKLQNVCLISPFCDSHDLIKNASAVVVINSTVGWESILHLKSVVVLAHPFYRGFDVTYDVDNLLSLPSKLTEAIAGQVSEKKVQRFVHAVLNSLVDGNIIAISEEQLQRAIEKTNVQAVSDNLERYIAKKICCKIDA